MHGGRGMTEPEWVRGPYDRNDNLRTLWECVAQLE